MKNAILTIILGLFIFTTLSAQENAQFPIKSGIVKYSTIGLGNGISTLYFDDYGKTICEDFNGTVWDQEIHTRTIVKGEIINILDMDEKTFTLENNTLMKSKIIEEYFFNEETYQTKGYINVGKDVVLGKNCKIYSLKKEVLIKVWVWQGLILKKEDDLLGGSVIYASSIEEMTPDKMIFEIPDDFIKQ